MPAVDRKDCRYGIAAEMFGLRAKAASADRRFVEAVGFRFEPYCRHRCADAPAPSTSLDLDAVLSVAGGRRPRRSEEEVSASGCLVFGRHLRHEGDRWLWRRSKALHGLEVAFRFREGRLEIEGTLHERNRGFLGLSGGARDRDIWTHCADVVFLMPLLALAFRTREWTPVHGSALAVRGKGVLIAGLAGCGKTTLAAAILTGLADSTYLAENVALVRDGLLWGLASPLRLDQRAIGLIGERELSGAADEWPEASRMLGSERSRCFRPKRRSAEPFPLAAVLFPRIGTGSGFRAMPTAEAAASLRLMDSLTYEMDGFWSWVRVLDIATCSRSMTDRPGREPGRPDAGTGHPETVAGRLGAGGGRAEQADIPDGKPDAAGLPFDAPAFEITLGRGMSAGAMRELAGRVLSEAGI
ncbi:MAG: hypothetical protein N3A38_07230 [Planctomycetota bacterium]|nr:hypothetical protein [Planctomycetota bacterium]